MRNGSVTSVPHSSFCQSSFLSLPHFRYDLACHDRPHRLSQTDDPHHSRFPAARRHFSGHYSSLDQSARARAVHRADEQSVPRANGRSGHRRRKPRLHLRHGNGMHDQCWLRDHSQAGQASVQDVPRGLRARVRNRQSRNPPRRVPSRPEGAEITDVIKTTATSLVPVLVTALLLKYIN